VSGPDPAQSSVGTLRDGYSRSRGRTSDAEKGIPEKMERSIEVEEPPTQK